MSWSNVLGTKQSPTISGELSVYAITCVPSVAVVVNEASQLSITIAGLQLSLSEPCEAG